MEWALSNTQQSHFHYLPNSQRSRHKLTIIEYDSKRRVFRALQLRNACEMKMGIRHRDGHYFFVEEVVWMVEAGQAAVLHRGIQMSIQQCYLLLGSFLITPAKFLVYSYLKRAGYVVLPHKTLLDFEDDEGSMEWKHLGKPFFPSYLLDQFPTLESMTLTQPLFLHNPKFMEIFGICESASKLNFEAMKISEQSKDFKEAIRPRYWPRFDRFSHHVSTWSEFRMQRAKILRKVSSKHVPNSPQLPIDYDVYMGSGAFHRNISPKPIYRLVVLDMSLPFPSISSLHWLSSQLLEGKLLIALVQHASIVFYNINHQRVAL